MSDRSNRGERRRTIRIPREQRLSVCRCGGICKDYPRCRHEPERRSARRQPGGAEGPRSG